MRRFRATVLILALVLALAAAGAIIPWLWVPALAGTYWLWRRRRTAATTD